VKGRIARIWFEFIVSETQLGKKKLQPVAAKIKYNALTSSNNWATTGLQLDPPPPSQLGAAHLITGFNRNINFGDKFHMSH
jgi:hypothetical protein